MILLLEISNLEDETNTLCQKGNFAVTLLRTAAEQITLGCVSLMDPHRVDITTPWMNFMQNCSSP